jgi:hypothetical protein
MLRDRAVGTTPETRQKSRKIGQDVVGVGRWTLGSVTKDAR